MESVSEHQETLKKILEILVLCANHMPDRIIRIPYTGELFSSFL